MLFRHYLSRTYPLCFLFLYCVPSTVNKNSDNSVTQLHRIKESVTISNNPVTNVLNRESFRLKAVYEDALKRNSSIAGDLKVQFNINPDGSVDSVSLVNCTISDTAFVNSILRYISNWSFPKVDNVAAIKVVYPFRFEPATK
jgi:TonB family protein